MIVDETALRQRAALGAKYKEHLADFHEAIDAVKADYIAEWPSTFDAEQREKLWVAVRICDKMKEHFGALVSDGQVASHQLAELKRLG